MDEGDTMGIPCQTVGSRPGVLETQGYPIEKYVCPSVTRYELDFLLHHYFRDFTDAGHESERDGDGDDPSACCTPTALHPSAHPQSKVPSYPSLPSPQAHQFPLSCSSDSITKPDPEGDAEPMQIVNLHLNI